MPPITNRIAIKQFQPYRKVRPVTSKIIFLSLEGCVTEEEYFRCISKLFDGIKSKIQFVSVAEDAVRIKDKHRTPEQKKMLSMVRPKQLVERIDQFKKEKDNMYEFEKYPDDEFWVVTDVDKNWSNDIIDAKNQKTYRDEWNDAVAMCQEKGYGYAISNPFFEIWLLLHHDEANDEDKGYAVTDERDYERTGHFRTRLEKLGVPIKSKHINPADYDVEKVKIAISRAHSLHRNKEDLYPKYFASTVYVLLNKMMEMI